MAKVKKETNNEDIYLGISGAEFAVDSFNFGRDISLRKTYAFVFAPYLVAFKKPDKPGQISPGPWKTVSGGVSKYITYELHIPIDFNEKEWFDRLNTAWWILSLLRLKCSSFLIGPVISNCSFSRIGELNLDTNFLTVEFNNDHLPIEEQVNKVITQQELEWVKDKWLSAGKLFRNNITFSDAYRAADRSLHEKNPSNTLVIIWGALERIFADFNQELRYRVSLNIATYLERAGDKRLQLFKKAQKLYNSRSKTAHGRPGDGYQEFKESYMLLRSSLLKMIDENIVPTITDIENKILNQE